MRFSEKMGFLDSAPIKSGTRNLRTAIHSLFHSFTIGLGW